MSDPRVLKTALDAEVDLRVETVDDSSDGSSSTSQPTDAGSTVGPVAETFEPAAGGPPSSSGPGGPALDPSFAAVGLDARPDTSSAFEDWSAAAVAPALDVAGGVGGSGDAPGTDPYVVGSVTADRATTAASFDTGSTSAAAASSQDPGAISGSEDEDLEDLEVQRNDLPTGGTRAATTETSAGTFDMSGVAGLAGPVKEAGIIIVDTGSRAPGKATLAGLGIAPDGGAQAPAAQQVVAAPGGLGAVGAVGATAAASSGGATGGGPAELEPVRPAARRSR
jgi:hypothetical protein